MFYIFYNIAQLSANEHSEFTNAIYLLYNIIELTSFHFFLINFFLFESYLHLPEDVFENCTEKPVLGWIF